MTNWMAALAAHCKRARQQHPGDRLLVVFDADGALIDRRRSFGAALRPYSGALETVRWLETGLDCAVGLVSARPESARAEVLAALNALGVARRVVFEDARLRLRPDGGAGDESAARAAGVRAFQAAGWRVVAVLDSAPEALAAVAAQDEAGEMLLLHAALDGAARAGALPPRALSGGAYRLADLIAERDLPPDVGLVWHGLNDEPNVRQFLASDIVWGECDVHLDPRSDRLVLHHDRLDDAPTEDVAALLTLDDLLARMRERGKAVKLDLKGGGPLIGRALALIERHGFDDDHLWLNGYLRFLGEAGVRQLAEARPGAILQAPVDFMGALAVSLPDHTQAILATLRGWGMNRFSLDFMSAERPQFYDLMLRWGFEVNLYGVVDLETFLAAVLLHPRSVTTDFNFPQWHYYGRGSGQGGRYYEYEQRAP
ncbi:MAG: hypothetical protein KJ047_04695 [Anaerolineae bacterium]|nr:hypothetical protein [Anaerolineae bacterium]